MTEAEILQQVMGGQMIAKPSLAKGDTVGDLKVRQIRRKQDKKTDQD